MTLLQDIVPHKFEIAYEKKTPQESDYFLYFEGNRALLCKRETGLEFLRFSDLQDLELRKQFMGQAKYLFRIDDMDYYGVPDSFSLMGQIGQADGKVQVCQPGRAEETEQQGLRLEKPGEAVVIADLGDFRDMEPQYQAFAGVTASQIYRFRKTRSFCGRCGHPMEYSTTERAMCCPECHNVEYPKISPAVTTAIIHGDKLLMAKSALGSFRQFALVAGYVELGETFEATVHREVMEEVGLKVKNVTYYKSQPWGFSDAEMVGFFAELDGDDKITLQESELADARWFTADEIEQYPSVSLTYEMVNLFKSGKVKLIPEEERTEGGRAFAFL